jgi:Rrf2 family protein
VEGVKGPGGGYRLARDAATIRVGDVVRAVEGPVAVVHCTLPGDEHSCNRMDRCVTHLLWKRLSTVITEFLDSVTLRDLCDEAQQLDQGKGPINGKHLR